MGIIGIVFSKAVNPYSISVCKSKEPTVKYTVAFSFVVDSSTTPLNANLEITDGNAISLDDGSIQIQPYGTASVPPLAYLTVTRSGINVVAGANPDAARQALEVVVAINAVGAGMTVNLRCANVVVDGSYRFIGYDSQARLRLGDTTIPFPV